MTIARDILDLAIRAALPGTADDIAAKLEHAVSTTTLRTHLKRLGLLGRVRRAYSAARGADVYADTGRGWDAPEARCGACERLSPEVRSHHPMRCLDGVGIVRVGDAWAPVGECGRVA